MNRVAENVSPLELADYQKAVRLILRHPLVTTVWPDSAALPTVRRWAEQLRADLPEILGYRLITTADTARLLRAQDELDATQPALTRSGRPFDRRRYAYLVLTLAALGRSGTQTALSELADAVAADALRIDGLGMDTSRKPDRDAFVDAVAWLETRGALRMADGSAVAWADDPDTAEALYDIDREVGNAIYQPGRVPQHLGSVTGLLEREGRARPGSVGRVHSEAGAETRRQAAAKRARRLVLEQPAVYYADVDGSLHGQLRGPALAADLERLTGLTLERRAEGVALIDTSGRLSDTRFPAGGTVAQAALLLAAKIADRMELTGLARPERLPAATAAERRAATAARIDSALPERGVVQGLLAVAEDPEPDPHPAPDQGSDGADTGAEAVYPFLSDSTLRTATRHLVAAFGAGMSSDLRDDPERLTAQAVALLASLRLVEPVGGGVLALPLLGRYRGVTAQVRPRTPAPPPPHPNQPALFDTISEGPIQ